jgi:hypothetical protein
LRKKSGDSFSRKLKKKNYGIEFLGSGIWKISGDFFEKKNSAPFSASGMLQKEKKRKDDTAISASGMLQQAARQSAMSGMLQKAIDSSNDTQRSQY